MSRHTQDAIVIRRLHLLSSNQVGQFANAQRPPRAIENFIDQASIEQIHGTLIHLLGRLPDEN